MSKFKQESLKDVFFNNKYLLYIDNKRKISLVQKDIVSIVRSMFKISTKEKGGKIKGEYFHCFEPPSFEKAEDISEVELVYAKEGNIDVLYVYDWDETNDNYVLKREFSKVLVSDVDLIRNILKK